MWKLDVVKCRIGGNICFLGRFVVMVLRILVVVFLYVILFLWVWDLGLVKMGYIIDRIGVIILCFINVLGLYFVN